MPPERLLGKSAKVSSSSTNCNASDAGIDFVITDTFCNQLVGHIVPDGERIEERALLENHAGPSAEGEEGLLAHVGDFLAEELDASLVGPNQTIDQLEQDALAYPGGPKQNARLTRRQGEADLLKNRLAVEGDRDIAEGDDGTGIRGQSRVSPRGSRIGRGVGGGLAHSGGKRVRST